MSYKLIGQDCALQLTLGGLADGVPNYTTATVYKSYARSISIDESAEVENVAALGDTRDKYRVKRTSTKVRIEGLVPDTGFVLNAAAGSATGSVDNTTVGCYCKVEYKEISGLSAYRMWEGIITQWSGSSPDGAAVESMEVTCDGSGQGV